MLIFKKTCSNVRDAKMIDSTKLLLRKKFALQLILLSSNTKYHRIFFSSFRDKTVGGGTDGRTDKWIRPSNFILLSSTSCK